MDKIAGTASPLIERGCLAPYRLSPLLWRDFWPLS